MKPFHIQDPTFSKAGGSLFWYLEQQDGSIYFSQLHLYLCSYKVLKNKLKIKRNYTEFRGISYLTETTEKINYKKNPAQWETGKSLNEALVF